MSAARFVTDSSLGWVARRLRVLGFDVLTVPGAGLEAIFEIARREDRTVLTLSRRRPPKHPRVPALVLDRADPAAALRTVTEHHEPTGEPFSRCTVCNMPLDSGDAAAAPPRIPERVRATALVLRHCPGCGRWYWRGSHVARLEAWLEETLGRAGEEADETEGSGEPGGGGC